MKVAIIMGSDSDLPVMEPAVKTLAEFGVGCEVIVASAHRTPDKVHEFAATAAERGVGAIIAAAGAAAHLPGVVASFTTLPVIGVPVNSTSLGGLDALLSIVQMPSGIPVATMAINGAKNAALFAVQILAAANPGLREKLTSYRGQMAAEVERKAARVAAEMQKNKQ
ncbi:MAG TPA: 5-(carboxyamino)imidazole ribonucleotide mutase [Selenomonadales bacterium]|nr:5-(carboxyamino)imidazole ribonucleotide mutase [Selenomonadales bacterium]